MKFHKMRFDGVLKYYEGIQKDVNRNSEGSQAYTIWNED